MNRKNIFAGALLTSMLLLTQVFMVGAAPAVQETEAITGVIESIAIETDAETGVTTVVVSLSDEEGSTQTVRLSLEDATALGLVTDDGAGNITINDAAVGQSIDIDSSTILIEEEEKLHPVASALSDFFSALLGVDYEMISTYHDDGVGFGVIAQALWMTNALEGGDEIFSAILDAKNTKDFSAITLPDGSTPQNWGQFRQAIMNDRDNSKENLGAVKSGHAIIEQDVDDQVEAKNNGSHKDKDKSNAAAAKGNADDNDDDNDDKNGNGNGNNNGNGNGKGNNKDKGKGHNK